MDFRNIVRLPDGGINGGIVVINTCFSWITHTCRTCFTVGNAMGQILAECDLHGHRCLNHNTLGFPSNTYNIQTFHYQMILPAFATDHRRNSPRRHISMAISSTPSRTAYAHCFGDFDPCSASHLLRWRYISTVSGCESEVSGGGG